MCSPYQVSARDDPADCEVCDSPLAGDNNYGICYQCRRQTGRTAVKIEREASPNGRYPITVSFLMRGQWHATNYTHTIEQAQQWAMREIEAETFAGPIIIEKESQAMFNRWLDTFIEEKELDTETVLEVTGQSGPNFIPLACVIEAIKRAPAHEQRGIKAMIVEIDFLNGNVLDYFQHLAQAIAI